MNLTIEQIEHADNIYQRIKTSNGKFIAVWFVATTECNVPILEPRSITEDEVRELIKNLKYKHRFDEFLKHPLSDPNDARVDRKIIGNEGRLPFAD